MVSEIIPPDDDFAAGDAPYGPIVRGYVPFRLAVDDRFLPGRIMSSSEGYGDAGAVGKRVLAVGGGDPGSCGILFRRYAPQDLSIVQVVVRLTVAPGQPVLTSSLWTHAGVVARVKGGVGLTPGGGEEADHYLQDVCGYAFLLTRVAASQYRFRLFRAQGTLTILAETGIISPTVAGFLDQVTLRMVCKAEAGDVRLEGWVSSITYSGASLGGTSQGGGVYWISTLKKVLDHLDTDLAKITDAGRVGFVSNGDVSVVGAKTSMVVTELKVRQQGQTKDWLRDRFERPGRTKLARAITDGHGVGGFDVGIQYNGDAQSAQTGAHRLQRSSSGGLFVQSSGSSFLKITYAMELRTATQPKSRARRFRFKSNSATAWAAPLVFASPDTSTFNVQQALPPLGYILFVKPVLGEMQLIRKTNVGSGSALGSGLYDELAKVTGLSIPLNVWHSVQLDAYQLAAPDGNGPVILTCALNDVPRAFISQKASGDPVIGTLLIDGALWDVSDFKQTGALDGFMALTNLVGERVDFDDWSQEALVFQDPVTPTAIAVTSESDGAFGTFSLPSCWEMRRADLLPVAREQWDSGRAEHLALATDARRVYRFLARYDQDDYAALLSFWESHSGPTLGFTWSPPREFDLDEDPPGTFHFAMPSIEPQRRSISGGVESFEVELVLEELLW